MLNPPSTRLRSLDGIRALSILWMIGFHVVWLAQWYLEQDDRTLLLDSSLLVPLWNGHLGVDVFFVMSGFLIARILMHEFDSQGSVSFGRFYLRRALRLLPAYYLVLFLTYFVRPNGFESVWANLLYVNNFVPFKQAYMQWTWSLAIEEQFYIVFPAFLLLLYRMRHYAIPAFLLLLVASLIVRGWVIVENFDVENFDIDALYTKPHTRFGPILCGVMAAYVARYTRFVERVGRHPRLFVAFSLLALGMVALASFTTATLLSAHPRLLVLWYASFRLCIALGVAWIILSDSGASLLDRTIHRCLQWRGWYPVAQLSYSAFLLHPLLIRIVYDTWSPSTVTGVLAAVPLFWVLSLLASMPLYLLVERPVMNLRSVGA